MDQNVPILGVNLNLMVHLAVILGELQIFVIINSLKIREKALRKRIVFK